MANSLISMIKGDSTLINNTEVLDGQVLFNTDEKTILLDDDNTRTKYCGADKSNKNLAPIENGNTATRGYAAGSYVVWKEQLYKVLTQINSGTAFVVGTNIALDTVGAELTQIKSDLYKDSVMVTANGVKTARTLLNELFALVDTSKVTDTSYIEFIRGNDSLIFEIGYKGSVSVRYGHITGGQLESLNLYNDGSTYIRIDIGDGDIQYTDKSQDIIESGRVFKLYY